MPVRRHFLPWDRPLLDQAVGFLAGDWSGAGPLDLSGQWVVVPTAQAGRRLRESLAARAAERDQAVFPPRLLTPDLVLAPESGPETDLASKVESLLAWSEVFQELDLAEYREVFPLDPPGRDFAWSVRLAEQFLHLQSELGEGGLRIADVPAKAGADFPEVGRWGELGALEGCYDEKLRGRGRRDAQAANIEAARTVPATANPNRIVLLAVPDPLALVLAALEVRAPSVDLAVVIFAPPEEAVAFDSWGRPLPDVWERRELALPDFDGSVHLCADPAAQSDRAVELAQAYGAPEGILALGVADAEVRPALEGALGRAGFATFDPDGRPWRRSELHLLLSALAGLARDPSFEAVAALARCPDFLQFLGGRLGASFSPARWLEGLDEMRQRHLPADLATARERAPDLPAFSPLGPGLEAMAELATKLGSADFAAGASSVLQTLFEGRHFDLALPRESEKAEAARAWTAALAACAAAGPGLAAADGWDLALKLFGDDRQTLTKPAGAVELLGWLELLWEDAGHLAILGCNDGSIPIAITGDPFLPETLRERLGLRTNARRLSRDNYLLAALAASRTAGGRLDLFVGRASAAGEPLRPSRLLLNCADAALPGRVQALFRPAPPARRTPPWQRAWALLPPEGEPLGRLRVTAFRDYLACPFRFYLRHVLGWSTLDPQKSELDASDFGTLCHAALEALGKDAAMRECADPATLRDFLLQHLEDRIRRRYGRDLILPVLVQCESARQRLGWAAQVQAEERRSGWVIAQTEEPIDFEIGGMRVVGTIDRIERQGAAGPWRVLDYKTSDAGDPPVKIHSTRWRAGMAVPEFARFTVDGVERVWTDLQLPLYVEAVSRSGRSPVLPAYFNLPKAAGETAVATWEDYGEEWRAAAQRCAAAIVSAVREGIFWPPAEIAARKDGDYAGIFHQGAAESIDPGFARRKAGR